MTQKNQLVDKKLKVTYGDINYYRTYTDTPEDVLLFIHGSGGSKNWFRPAYDRFDGTAISFKQHSWIVPSLMGYPGSSEFTEEDGIEPFAIEQFAQDLLDILLYEQVKSVTILGHSMGGLIGILLVKKIVEHAGITIKAFFNMEGSIIGADIDDDYGKKSFTEYQMENDQYMNELKIKADTGDEEARFLHRIFSQMSSYTIWGAYTHMTKLCEEDNVIGILKNALDIKSFPVYFVYGEDEELATRIPSYLTIKNTEFSKIMVPSADHHMFVTNPEFFWNTINDIIRS